MSKLTDEIVKLEDIRSVCQDILLTLNLPINKPHISDALQRSLDRWNDDINMRLGLDWECCKPGYGEGK